MVPTKPRDDAPPPEYEQLRRHLGRPPLEHPAGRARVAPPPASPAMPPRRAIAPVPHRRPAAAAAPAESRLSVMEWLLAVGHVVARRVRGVPRSPMIPLHPRK
ncbi:MAG TPA: hypothetical protein VGD37_14155 [Kofleriaceae bacterium]|jgi:hypothetical protein